MSVAYLCPDRHGNRPGDGLAGAIKSSIGNETQSTRALARASATAFSAFPFPANSQQCCPVGDGGAWPRDWIEDPTSMAEPRKRRPRDPEATREIILEAAGNRLAKDGPEGLSLSEVAALAGVNRGTAYQHFETREKLIKATSDWVAGKLFRAVFGEPDRIGERDVEQVDMNDLTDRLASFAMENPELCRVWLLQVLSSPNPASDPFWREYQGSIGRFAKTELSQRNVDSEVLSVIMLAGTFLWPVWARAHAQGPGDCQRLAKRFTRECLRLSMYGSLQSARFPEIAKLLEETANEPPAGEG